MSPKLSPVALRMLRVMERFSSASESCDPERLMEWGRGESNCLNSLIGKGLIEQFSYRGYRLTEAGRAAIDAARQQGKDNV